MVTMATMLTKATMVTMATMLTKATMVTMVTGTVECVRYLELGDVLKMFSNQHLVLLE